MYSYSDQLKVIEKARVADGQTKRISCPFCGGRNTFTITRKGKGYVWNCYRASCGVAGGKDGPDSIGGIKSRINSGSNTGPDSNLGLAIPTLTSIENQDGVKKYLDSVHATQAYSEGLIDLRYAPSEDRIMFPVAGGIGYTGRARQGVKPKWQKYGDTSSPLLVGTGKTAVVVEDAPSACAVGVVAGMTGAALLGTLLTRQHILTLRSYEKVIVCLDPDAKGKGRAMMQRLQGTVPTVMCLIPDDLKNFEPAEIEEILCLQHDTSIMNGVSALDEDDC